MSATPPRNVLLVEGDTDRRVIPFLIEGHGVQWGDTRKPIVTITSYEGASDLLAPNEIETQLKASGLGALGVIVDADADLTARWRQVRAHAALEFPSLPEIIPKEGVIAQNATGLRFGAWIMPDNVHCGMLETFLNFLRPSSNPALAQHAKDACSYAKAVGAPFSDSHSDKAQIHCWLSWQDPPGLQLHQAVMAKVLDPNSPHANAFVAWFRSLFGV